MSDKQKMSLNNNPPKGILGNIPNLFTLINLIFGCLAIVCILQTGETIVLLDNTGATQVFLPERIWIGSLFIFGAAIIDFLDGFLARAMKASSAMGAQLDSLSDVVSFGVAPGMILYQLLRIGFAQQENGLDVSTGWLLPAFIFSAAVAWRLAKFNISTDQTDSFKGVPSPAAGLVVASFPLIVFYQYFNVQQFFINPWVLYAVIFILSWLMVSNKTFMAIKFKDYSIKNNRDKYILFAISIALIVLLKWLAVPVIFVLYLIMSLTAKTEQAIAEKPVEIKETKDITV